MTMNEMIDDTEICLVRTKNGNENRKRQLLLMIFYHHDVDTLLDEY